MEHLPRDGSDRAHLLLKCENKAIQFQRPFKFLKFWTKLVDFKEVVRRNRDSGCSDNPFIDFKRKIKQVKKALTVWSRQACGDIFQQLIIREEIAKVKEKLFLDDPSQDNRMVMQKAKAEYIKYLHLEESF